MTSLSIISVLMVFFIGALRSFAGQPLDPQSLVIEYSDSCVNIGPLRFIGGKTTITEVEGALGKPDRTTASNYVQYCYDSLGLRFIHPSDSSTKIVKVLIFMNEKQTDRDILAFGRLAPGRIFPGVIRLRGIEIKAPRLIKEVHPKLNPLFPRKEAVPGNDQFGNTLYRYGQCQTDFVVRKATGELTVVTLDRPMPK